MADKQTDPKKGSKELTVIIRERGDIETGSIGQETVTWCRDSSKNWEN